MNLHFCCISMVAHGSKLTFFNWACQFIIVRRVIAVSFQLFFNSNHWRKSMNWMDFRIDWDFVAIVCLFVRLSIIGVHQSASSPSYQVVLSAKRIRIWNLGLSSVLFSRIFVIHHMGSSLLKRRLKHQQTWLMNMVVDRNEGFKMI